MNIFRRFVEVMTEYNKIQVVLQKNQIQNPSDMQL